MKHFFPIILIILVIGGFLFVLNYSLAQVTGPAGEDLTGLAPIAAAGLPATDIRIIIAKIIRIILGFVGVVGVGVVLYGGFIWMTAAGNEEKISTAKKILLNGTVGLVIIISAFSIVSYVIGRLEAVTGAEIAGPPGGAGPFVGGGLGTGIVESHYPARNATDIPRNTKIIVTFKEKMLASSIVNNNDTPDNILDDKIQTKAVKIRKTVDDPAIGPFVVNVNAAYTEDLKTFVFDPIDLLGSAAENISYTVVLTSEIKKINGDSAFGAFGNYEWSFEVSTVVDSKPPQIESVVPAAETTNPRNIIVQINFNEAIDPTSASGSTLVRFTNIVVNNNTDNAVVDGTFTISNQYKTVEFLSNNKCGVNSCGEDIFCLPGNKDLSVLVKAAALSTSPPEGVFPYDGIVDVVGNSLDGNKDSTSSGPPTDNYSWIFKTNNTIDLVPPKIETLNPQNFASNVPLDETIKVFFSKLISSSSVNTSSLILEGMNYWTGLSNNTIEQKSTALIYHDLFNKDADYSPQVTSGIRDIMQNCYQPCVGPE